MNTIQTLLFQNSHWKEGLFETFEFKRDLFSKIWTDLDTKVISLLTGPRRVGKSVLLKQIANELIQKNNVGPRQILFYEFSPNEKSETIWEVFNYFTKEITDSRLPIFIFFDEIQYISGYESVVKNIYDNTTDCKIFLTGSLSLSYKKKMQESLAGRFFTYQLFPLNFLEFLKLGYPQSLDLYNKAKKEKDSIQREATLLKLNADFREFLAKGRYPETINFSSDQNKSYLTNIINQSLNQDTFSYFQIEKPLLINGLFEYIRQVNGGLISVNKLASQFGVSNQTVASYLAILEQMGLIYIVYNSLSPIAKAQGSKKAYINSAFSLLDTKYDLQTAMGTAVESYILERLLDKNETVTFWRKRDKEVDFLLPNKKLGIEVKFRNDLPKIKNPLKDYYLKIVSATGEFPACLF